MASEDFCYKTELHRVGNIAGFIRAYYCVSESIHSQNDRVNHLKPAEGLFFDCGWRSLKNTRL